VACSMRDDGAAASREKCATTWAAKHARGVRKYRSGCGENVVRSTRRRAGVCAPRISRGAASQGGGGLRREAAKTSADKRIFINRSNITFNRASLLGRSKVKLT
jgi:hypothetical protein